MKIMLDAGHGQGITHNRGSVIGNEGDNNYAYSLILKKELESYGIVVGLTRNKPSDDPSLDARGKMAAGYDIFISLHSNAASASVRGTEIWNGVTRPVPSALANTLVKNISDFFGHNNRGVKTRKLDGTNVDYYGVLRSNAAKTGMLIEHGFHTNKQDAGIYVNKRQGLAEVTAKTIATYYGLKKKTAAKTPIEGKSEATAEQMKKFLLDNNKDPKINGTEVLNFCKLFIDEGVTEGIRGDIAFCQSIHETGWFKFGGLVLPEQNNYGGIGATNNSDVGKGAWFDTPQLGVRAQIQHLKAYANNKSLVNSLIDPRFNLVTRGSAPNWEDLNGKWAVPGNNYGQGIVDLFNKLKQVKTTSSSGSSGSTTKPKPEPQKPAKKSIDEMAQEVIAGKHGNYPERKTKLESLGYNYQQVQDRVNEILLGAKPAKPTTKTSGKWLVTTPAGMNVRSAPSTSAAKVASYQAGQTVNINSTVTRNGYIWGVYTSYSGYTRYIALQPVNGAAYGKWI